MKANDLVRIISGTVAYSMYPLPSPLHQQTTRDLVTDKQKR